MGKRRAERPARRRLGLPPQYVAAAAVLAVLVAAAGLLWGGPDRRAVSDAATGAGPASASTSTPGTATAAHSTELLGLEIPREPFCGDLDDEKVPVALGAPVEERESYEPGERVEIAPGIRDVSDEHGCLFRGSGAEARVWVFAASVGPRQAAGLAREAGAAPGCRRIPARTSYGRPGLTRLCTDGDQVEASLRGLFGDAWLTCQLRERPSAGDEPNPDDVRSRAEQWCVHVATTLGGRG